MDKFSRALFALLVGQSCVLGFVVVLAYLSRPSIEIVKVRQVPPVIPTAIEVVRR